MGRGPEPETAPSRVIVYGMNHAPELVGVGRYTSDIVCELIRRDHSVSVVTTPPHYPYWSTRPWREKRYSNRYAQEMLDGARVWRCPLLLRHPMRGPWRLLAPLSFAITSAPVIVWRILRDRPRLVICIEPTLLAAPAALTAARLVGARIALHVQDLEPETSLIRQTTAQLPEEDPGQQPKQSVRGRQQTRRAGPRSWAIRQLAGLRSHFDCVITLSNGMRTALVRAGVAEKRIHISPNWTDVRRIARGNDTDSAHAWRSEMDIRNDQRIALYAGAINRKHAPLLLAGAARRLHDVKDVVFVVVGEGPLRQSLVAATADLPNVRFLPLQPEDKLPALLHFADVHVMPQDETWDELALPSRLAGMLASGKPMVVTAREGSDLAGFLNGAATLACPGDADALAAAIMTTLRPATPEMAARQKRRRLRLALRLDKRRCLKKVVDVLTAATSEQADNACSPKFSPHQ